MEATVREGPLLSDAEWKLIIELLERERSDLPGEIHHTDTATVRDELQRRLRLIENLLERLRRSMAPGA